VFGAPRPFIRPPKIFFPHKKGVIPWAKPGFCVKNSKDYHFINEVEEAQVLGMGPPYLPKVIGRIKGGGYSPIN